MMAGMASAAADGSKATPFAVEQILKTFSSPNPDVGEMGILMEKWAGNDLPAALNWTATLPAGPMRDVCMASTAIAWVNTDPIAAAAALREQVGDPGVLHDGLRRLAERWGASDLRAMRAWTATLEGTQAHAALLGGNEAASATKFNGPGRR